MYYEIKLTLSLFENCVHFNVGSKPFEMDDEKDSFVGFIEGEDW